MDNFDNKHFTVSRGYTYNYYVSPVKKEIDGRVPALLLVHGWPDDSNYWQVVAPQLLALPHRIVIPDLLGVGGSSKPKSVAAYNFSYITKDFVDILDHEQVDRVILIGHDWGAGLVGRFWLYAPTRVAGMVLLNVAYTAPTEAPFDLPAVNEMTKRIYGFGLFEYWNFFTSDEGTKLMSNNPDKVWQICHMSGPQEMMWCYPDKMRDFLLDKDATMEVRWYAKDEKLKKQFIDRIRRDGFETFQMYYRAWMDNVQHESEKALVPKERHVVTVPVLYVGCTEDAVARPESINMPKEAGLLPDLKIVTIESGHWCALDKPNEVSHAVEQFVLQRFPV